jgi:peptidylprolyl isomerase
MNKVHPGDTVIIEYSGTLGDGTVVLASLPEDPYQFQVGHHETIPALEETVLGMSPGETRSISLRAEEAFGPYRPELIRSVSREDFPPDLEIESGQRLPFRVPSGAEILVTVIAALGSEIIIDANHPLAGLDLTFEIRLIEIRKGHDGLGTMDFPFATDPRDLPDMPS